MNITTADMTAISLEFSVPNIEATLALYTDYLATRHQSKLKIGSGKNLLNNLQTLAKMTNKPKVLLRTTDDKIYEVEDVKTLVDTLFRERNRAESARNLVAVRLTGIMADVRNKELERNVRESFIPIIRAFERYSVWHIRHAGDHEKAVTNLGSKMFSIIEDYFEDALKQVDELNK